MGSNKNKKRYCGIARKVGKFKKHSLRSKNQKPTKKQPKHFNKNKMTALKVFTEKHILKQKQLQEEQQDAMKESS